jgi:hypothetical protein
MRSEKVFGETPNTATGTVALPETAALDGIRGAVSSGFSKEQTVACFHPKHKNKDIPLA